MSVLRVLFIESTKAEKQYGWELAISRQSGAPPAEPLVAFSDDDNDAELALKHLIQDMVEFNSERRPQVETVKQVIHSMCDNSID